jgi:hypothetical protein
MGRGADSYRALETTFTKMGSYYQRISSLQRKRPDKKRESMSDISQIMTTAITQWPPLRTTMSTTRPSISLLSTFPTASRDVCSLRSKAADQGHLLTQTEAVTGALNYDRQSGLNKFINQIMVFCPSTFEA